MSLDGAEILCEAAVAISFGPAEWVECGEPAIQVHRYACVHEHVVDRFTCLEHTPVKGDVGCRQCFAAGHECPMAFQLVPA